MIIILKLKNAPAVLRLRRRLRTHAWLAVCWFLLIFPLPGMCLVVSQNSSSKSSSLYEDEVCLLSRTSSLKEACQGSLSDTGEHLTWVSLIKMTRDCAIDYPLNENQSQSADDAYGLFWHIGTETEFDSFLEQFNNNTGLRVGGRSRSIGEYIRSWLDVWPTPAIPGPHDYWFISAEVFGESIGSRDVFLDLTRLLINDADYRLTDIPAVFRDAGSAAYAGSYSALPLWLTSYQLLYRRDVFEAHNIAVPHTWDAALEIANQYGKGALGPGQPDLGFCFEANPACGFAHAMFIFIVGAIVQLQGPSHGTWFDPTNMDPMYGNPAVLGEALRLFMALKAHSVPDSNPCFAVYGMLASGRCLMLWGFSYAFKHASHNSSAVSGRQGVAPTPGSLRVLDRSNTSNGLVPCTRTLCPYADLIPNRPSPLPPSTIPPTPTSTTANMSSSEAGSNTSIANHGSEDAVNLVNRIVPFETGSFAINKWAPLHRQAAAYMMLHEFTGPRQHRRMMLNPITEVTPLRMDDLDVEIWVEAGYDRRDVMEFLQVYQHDLQKGNVYYELRIPGVFKIYTLIQRMLIEALGSNSTLDELLEPLLASLRSGTTKVFSEGGGKERLLQLYQRSLAYKGPLSPPPQPASQRRRNKMVLLALLIPTAAVLLMAVAALWGFSHWSRVENARRAKTRGAPGVGPATTLLVTDIQDSTPLWEILPAEVMDSAVKLHQRVLRELLLKHAGYESATEGDSFILAFHRPDRALGFALAAQEALLAADWPQDLLASPHAAPLVVRRDAAAAAAVAASLVTPSPLREALSLDHAALSEMPLPASVAMSPLAPPRALRPQPPTSLAASPTPPDRRGSRRLLTQGSLELPTPTGPRALAAVGPSGIPPPLPLLPPPPLLPGNRIFGRLRSMSLDGRLSAPFTRMPATLEAVHSDGGSGGQVMIDYLQDLETPRFDGGGRIRPSLLAVAVRMARLTSGRKMPWSSQASLRQLYGALTEDGSGIPKGGATGSPHVRRNTFAGTLAAVAVATTSVGGRSDAYSLGGGTTTPGNTVAENGGDAVEVHRDGAAAAVRLVEAFAQVFPREDVYDTVGPSTGRVILFRGLRVRMGLECGIHSDAEVQYNRTSGRIAYPGPTLQLTKAIADFGQGGQITLSERAAKDVTSRLGGVAYGGGGRMASGSITPYVVLAIGTHVLKGAETAVELYGVYSKGLVARAGHIASPRTQGEKIPSVLSAPLGRVVVALAQVQDPDDFADWGLEVSVGGHREMLKEAGTLACLHGGYLVPTPPGSFQAVFCQPESAVRWILELQDDLGPVTTTAGEKGRKSPSGLLATGSSRAALRSSLLLSFQSPSSAGGSLDTGDVLNRLQRATAAARLSVLRVKGGVAAGDTLATLHVRGNMKYSGGAAKQAACLAANAVWHEVLASIEVACAVEGKDYPALAELRQQQMRLSNRSKRRYQLVMHPMLQLCPSIAQQQLQPSLQQRPGSGRLGPLPPGLAAAAAAAKLPTRALSEDDVVARIIFEQQQQQQQGQEQEQTHRRLPQQQVQVLLQQSRETATSGGSLAAEITREIDALRPSLLPGDVPSPPSVPPLRPRPPSVPLLAPVARPPVSNLSFRSSLLRTPQMSPLPQPSLPPRLLKCPPPPPQQQQQQQQQQQSQPGRPGGTRGLGTAAADAATRHLQWGTETRKVKYKGGSMLACWVRFGQDPVTLDVMPPPSPSLPQPPALPLPAVSPPPPPPS